MSSSSLNIKPKQNFTINISPRQPEKIQTCEKNDKFSENEKKAVNSVKKYFQEKNEDKFFKPSSKEQSSYEAYNVEKTETKFNFGIDKHEKKANPEKTLRCVIDENCPKKPLTLMKTASERKPNQNQEDNNKIDELANLRHQRRSNTQFIEDMKSNISMQFEKLKEFKVTRTNFQRVLQEKENELDLNFKERTAFDENDYRINYSQEKLPSDYQNNFKQQTMQNIQNIQNIQNDYRNNLSQDKNKNTFQNNRQSNYKNGSQEQESDSKSNYSQSDFKQKEQCDNKNIRQNEFDYKNAREFKNNYTQERQREVKNTFTEEKQRSNYTEEKQTIRKEARKDEEIFNYRKKYTEENLGNNKYSKSISCHFFNKKTNEEEEYDGNNEGKISNKFSSNKTSSYLYGQMKIQEKKAEIDEKVMILKQNINRAKKDGNTQIKEIYKLFEELNECYQSIIFS